KGKELHIGFPGMSELLFLKLISNVFSVSDNHVIITPAIIYMCQCLSNCTIETCKDVGAGIFLCSLLLHVTSFNSTQANSVSTQEKPKRLFLRLLHILQIC